MLRDALTALVRCEGQLRKIRVNLNQAVARLNSTGQGDGDLVPYAAAITRAADRLEEWALRGSNPRSSAAAAPRPCRRTSVGRA